MDNISRKNNDCYFYYYSTCMKGENCSFRHEPTALGCEVVCSYWQSGKCINQRCNFRHMELKKNRKTIPCYWETQPTGCRKPHCPFLHRTPRESPPEKTKEDKSDLPGNKIFQSESYIIDGDIGNSSNRSGRKPSFNFEYDVEDGSNVVQEERIGSRRVSQGSDASYGSPSVDPIVVTFEEESDNESVPSSTPLKTSARREIPVKTLEEIRLEKIQAESAAFYSMSSVSSAVERVVKLKPAISDSSMSSTVERVVTFQPANTDNFKVLSLAEIRLRRAQGSDEPRSQPDSTTHIDQKRPTEDIDLTSSHQVPANVVKEMNKESWQSVCSLKRTMRPVVAASKPTKLKLKRFRFVEEDPKDSATVTSSCPRIEPEQVELNEDLVLSPPVDVKHILMHDSDLLKDIDELLCD